MSEPARRTIRIATAVLLGLGCTWAGAQPRGDACQARIPRSLANALAAAFPGYRTPLEYDNAPEDIKQRPASEGCLGVATADFTGEGKTDYVIGLTAVKGSKGLAVIALPRRGGWNFQRIRSGAEDARYLQYVDAAKPGRYERPRTVTAPFGPGEQPAIDCPNWAAVAGSVESSGLLYCYDHGRWTHVRVSN